MNKVSKTQIVATLGPASKELAVIKAMVAHQMDVARLNFSWGTYEEHADYISNVRLAAQEAGRSILIIQDLSGPREQEQDGHHFDGSEGNVLTPKDLKDLEFGLSQKVDYVAMSYVGTENDVLGLRNQIKKLGEETKVIAKIERNEALKNIDKIIESSDAIMIARGDLGNAVPLEQIPFLQRSIIHKCKAVNKPVITATQMLLSMTQNNKPTRAEVTDVAFAILNGSDAVMLSEESARGKYPVEAVAMMEKIVLEAEKYLANLITINTL
jgi:pyruvate kinase